MNTDHDFYQIFLWPLWFFLCYTFQYLINPLLNPLNILCIESLVFSWYFYGAVFLLFHQDNYCTRFNFDWFSKPSWSQFFKSTCKYHRKYSGFIYYHNCYLISKVCSSNLWVHMKICLNKRDLLFFSFSSWKRGI